MSETNFDDGIKGPEFRSQKERLLILHHLLGNHRPELNQKQAVSLRDAVLGNRDNQKALKLLKGFAKGGTTRRSALWRAPNIVLTSEEAMWRDANDYARSLSDSSFLTYVKKIPATSFLHDAAVDCEKAAYTCLRTLLDSLTSGLSQKISSIQKEERNKQVTCSVKIEEEKELKPSRVEFFRKIEELSRERSKS